MATAAFQGSSVPHHCRRCVNNVINPPSLHAQLVIPFLLGPGHGWDEELCSQDVTVDPRMSQWIPGSSPQEEELHGRYRMQEFWYPEKINKLSQGIKTNWVQPSG